LRGVITAAVQGHSRSVALAAAALMAEDVSQTPDAALQRIKHVRTGASPNHRQVAALEAWAKQYHSRDARAVTAKPA
jgi:protein-tyrosine phosphatase